MSSSVSSPTQTGRIDPASVIPTHRDLYYGGEWHAPVDGRYVPTLNPGLNRQVGEAADASAQDVDAAVKAAHAAYPAWRRMKPMERAAIMRRAANVLREHAEELALIDAINTGNPVSEMISDANIAAASLDYFAGVVMELKGSTIPMGDDRLNYTLREPLGVVARIVAYNHPFMFVGAKIAAPLAAGNTVVMKSAEPAPLSGIRLAELIGPIFPPGVLNILSGGKECGQALTVHPLVKKITLIGSVPTGKAIMRSAADSLKPVLLELGGKNALIGFPDADVKALTDGLVRGMNFTWAGQSCGSTSRAFIHASIYDQVVEGAAKLTRERHKPGMATDWSTTMGCVINQTQYDKIMKYINSGKDEGARLVIGGKHPDTEGLADGFFIEPTIFADVNPDMTIAREEIFGPVLSMFKWEDEDELFEMVNRVELGLTASIWTRDLVTAHRAAQRVEAGYVWINDTSKHFLGAPFGGYKQSGIGREECFEELLEFSQIKNVNVNLAP
jgi:betaine-aldehyde dehydrogenase